MLAAKRPFFKELLRLRDSSGKWATEYDSVIQPFMEVYDPESKRTRPLDPQYTLKHIINRLHYNMHILIQII